MAVGGVVGQVCILFTIGLDRFDGGGRQEVMQHQYAISVEDVFALLTKAVAVQGMNLQVDDVSQ